MVKSLETRLQPYHKGFCDQYAHAREAQADAIADELLNFERAWLASDDGLKRYDTLLRIAEKESRATSSLATRLRITRQATDHPTTAGRASGYTVTVKFRRGNIV